ncbi:carbohydrate ABC transporter permease [Nonomuraea sp. NEAU-A123]|uniref:carbohydrate ABC transporter permease n=1 Tax=Nonomuraea sp. NEAU-A123 TaxID=2839649 RepID=UPI001BE3D34C|nr:sugar ABC transporter permease [Nonomuraea sp. NEAU-A123]MBT2230023.1 sugar ABC transporter permease [Nonomuraea sp. NEAU-A123]MBT2230708.1 sugar ABC transporter permease [Nonomuraea sp. NEAU-A123]
MARDLTTSISPPRATSARGGERAAGSRRVRRPHWRGGRARGWLYVFPALAVYLGFAIWPALNTLRLSFLNWDGILPATSAGLDNYIKIFRDSALYEAILHSLVLIVFFSFIPICVGLFMTALLMGKVRRGMTFFRIVFFLPQVLPLVAVGITWRWLYSDTGVVNQLLDLVGLGGITRAWLGDYQLALVALGFIGTWAMSGLCMMLFLAGAQKIDPSLYEAATLDGANSWRQFLHVTLPGVRKEITIAGVITTIAALASFDLVFTTTNGGPAGQTNVPALLVYRLAFNEGDIGGASALAVVLTVLVIAVVSAIRYFTRDES